MVSLFTEIVSVRFWLKTVDYSKVVSLHTHSFPPTGGAVKHHSAPLEMRFPTVSFFTEVKIFRFWPKTIDYNL